MYTLGRTPRWLARAFPQGTLRYALASCLPPAVVLAYLVATFVDPQTFCRRKGSLSSHVTPEAIWTARTFAALLLTCMSLMSALAWRKYLRPASSRR